MRKTFDRAKRKKKHNLYIKTNDYELFFLLLPILPFVMFYDWLDKKWYDSLTWSEDKASKVLDSFLPNVVSYHKESYSYCMEWRYNNKELCRYAPLGYKKWSDKFYFQIREYLETGYENENYDKEVIKNRWETWIVFKEKKV